MELKPEIVNRMSEWINTALERPRVKDYLLSSGSTACTATCSAIASVIARPLAP